MEVHCVKAVVNNDSEVVGQTGLVSSSKGEIVWIVAVNVNVATQQYTRSVSYVIVIIMKIDCVRGREAGG